MAESCMICGQKMYVGEALKLSTPTGEHLGFVHRTCFYGKSDVAKEDPKEGYKIELKANTAGNYVIMSYLDGNPTNYIVLNADEMKQLSSLMKEEGF